MKTGETRSLRALLARLALPATAAGFVSILLVALVFSFAGTAVPAKAAAGGTSTVVTGFQTGSIAETDPCQSNGDETGSFHIDGHCSAPCGPQVGTSVSQAGLWRTRPPAEQFFVVMAPSRPETDAPEPFPPRIPNHA